jgi:hypothetical protein
LVSGASLCKAYYSKAKSAEEDEWKREDTTCKRACSP